MSEIYIVQAEYLDKVKCSSVTYACGWSPYYGFAKKRCHATVQEDIEEGTIPDGTKGVWNEPYDDIYVYEDDEKFISISVEAVDPIESKQHGTNSNN